ncbi:MAG: hypothetical protein IIT65_15895, partial [Lachnospiraceae bacterium]|nr:hypothetical protein [Lachnospiraceae bacterium]
LYVISYQTAFAIQDRTNQTDSGTYPSGYYNFSLLVLKMGRSLKNQIWFYWFLLLQITKHYMLLSDKK